MDKRYKVLLTVLLMILCPVALFAADATIKGKVTDAQTGDPLPGANVVIKGTVKGTITDEDGMFTITKLRPGSYTVRVSFIGYGLMEKMVSVTSGATVTADFGMTQAVISGATIQITSNRARERETPVAFTDVSKAKIAANLGSRDIPLVLNTTPSVYATATGGGAGDARINVRGFNQRNVAIMINGVPTNDMENGWLYWSNWDGVADVTSSIQVQRGLSATNLAVPSIGGTLNILTDPSALERGISLKQEIGNTFNMRDDRFTKSTLVFNSGLLNEKYAFSAAVVRKTGDGVIDRTWTDAWAYYLAASFQINANNRLELYAIGAPQRHGQNLYRQNIGAYSSRYARTLDDYDPDALIKFPEAGRKYNENWAPVDPSYDGKQAWNGSTHDRYDPNFLNERENFFHKPQVNLNWFSRLNDKLGLYSISYYSGGKGGGTGTLNNRTASGSSAFIWDYSGPSRVANWDANIAMNRGDKDRKGGDKIPGESLAILRNSRNNQWTIGNITKLEYGLSDALKVTGGFDWRTAEIEHYREVRDLLGGNYFRSTASDFWTTEEQQKRKLGEKVNYNFTNTVDWLGFFGQAEYSFDKISAYGMAGWSTIKYGYTNHFKDDGTGNELTAETDNITGIQFKGGASYRISDDVHIYGNFGHVEKVPIFDNVINDRDGTKATDPVNEKFDSFEAGINYRLFEGKLSTKLSAYRTTWKDRANSLGVTNQDGTEGLIFLTGMDILHQGIEIESAYRPNRNLRLDGSISLGDWYHTDDVSGVYKDYGDESGATDQNFNFYVNDLKVGDAPQTQISLGGTIMTDAGFQAGLIVRHYRDFYADWDPFDRSNIDERGIQSWKVPNATIVDLHASYKLPIDFGGISPILNLNVFNLMDKIYIQDALDNSPFNGFDKDHDADDAEVFFGLPRYFNLGITLNY